MANVWLVKKQGWQAGPVAFTGFNQLLLAD
jgi:hypothetical protein